MVPCTRAALRRPSVWSAKRRKEGCFSPAVGKYSPARRVAWNNPARRGPTRRAGEYFPAWP
jgi:hypothetical protein